MPNDLYERFMKYEQAKNKANQEASDAIEESGRYQQEISDVSNIVGKSITSEQLNELKELLNKEEENDDNGFNENEAPF